MLSKGKENPPSLFCVFGSFCHITKETALLFLTEKNTLSFLLEEEQVRSCFPKQGDDGTFPQRRKRVRCFASTPKVRFADRNAIRGGEAAKQLRYSVCFVQTESLSLDCKFTVLLQSLQCLAVVIHFTQSLYGLSLSRLRQTIVLCFPSILQLLETLRIPKRFYPLYLSKGLGLKREGEASFPFLCFWFLLSQYKRNILFSFPWKRNSLPSSWKRCRFFPAFHSRGTGGTFLQSENGTLRSKVHVPKALFRGSRCDPWGKAGSPALRSRPFGADFSSVPMRLTPVLLQFLQSAAMSFYFTPKFVQTCYTPWGIFRRSSPETPCKMRGENTPHCLYI